MGAMKPEETGTAIAVASPQPIEPFELLNPQTFQRVWAMAASLAECDLLPKAYHSKPANVLIAMEAARVMRMSLLQVAQNLQVIEGKPGWSASFIIGAINATRRFSPLAFEFEDRGSKRISYNEWVWSPPDQRKKPVERVTEPMPDRACRAVAEDLRGRVRQGPWISIEMAVQEGWYFRNNSKWQTMTDVMLTYRAAAFFGRIYAPEITLGMLTDDEVRDSAQTVASPAVAPLAGDLATQIREKVSAKVEEGLGDVAETPVQGSPSTPPNAVDALRDAQGKLESVRDAPTLNDALTAFCELSEEQRAPLEKLLPARIETVLNDLPAANTPEVSLTMSAVHKAIGKVKARAVQNALNAIYRRKYEDVKGDA